MTRRRRILPLIFVALAVAALSLVPIGLVGLNSAGAAISQPYSWNPKITCPPLLVRITDITANSTGTSSYNSSPFSPGITTTVIGSEAKRWLTPGQTPPGWVSPGPPCTVTNSKGTTSLFVQINGLERNDLTNEDWSTIYDPANGGSAHGLTGDTTFNLFDPVVVPHYFTSCTSSADPTCYGRIHAEIDHDWKAAGYCGAGTACDNSTLASQTVTASTKIDVQGFIYWDPGNLNSAWHQFSGWEIHPLTAWRPAADTTPPTWPAGSTLTASNIGTTSLSLSWTAATDDRGVTAYKIYQGNSILATVSANVSSYNVIGLTAGTIYRFSVQAGDSADNWSTDGPSVTVSTTNFSISSNPSSITIGAGGTGYSTITLSSLNGFTGAVALDVSVSPSSLTGSISPSSPVATLSQSSLFLVATGTAQTTLTVSTSLLTLPGTYTVRISATSGSVQHQTVVTVNVGLPVLSNIGLP